MHSKSLATVQQKKCEVYSCLSLSYEKIFADIQEKSADIREKFADIQGKFADIRENFANLLKASSSQSET